MRGAFAPLAQRNHTEPSGRTRAAEIWPSGCSIGVTAPVATSNRYRRCRPSTRFARSSADPSGHQSNAATSPCRPVCEVGPRSGRGLPDRGGILARAARGSRRVVRRPRRATRRRADRLRPSSRRSATTAPVRGSTTRSAGCSMSPPSQCCRHEERTVGREPAAVEPGLVRARPHAASRCCGTVSFAGPPSIDDVHREPVAIADRRGDDHRALARTPRSSPPGCRRGTARVPAGERCGEPSPDSSPVSSCHHRTVAHRRRSTEPATTPTGWLGHLAALARGQVPDVDLPDAALGALVRRRGRERAATSRASRQSARGGVVPSEASELAHRRRVPTVGGPPGRSEREDWRVRNGRLATSPGREEVPTDDGRRARFEALYRGSDAARARATPCVGPMRRRRETWCPRRSRWPGDGSSDVPEGEAAMPWLLTTARKVLANHRRAAESRTRASLVGPRAGIPDHPEDVVGTAVAGPGVQRPGGAGPRGPRARRVGRPRAPRGGDRGRVVRPRRSPFDCTARASGSTALLGEADEPLHLTTEEPA